MKHSYSWLAQHIDGKLPPLAELVERITFRAFEVEGVVGEGEQAVLDIKVLPNRAHDALSHRGMAREIAALFKLPRKREVIAETTTDGSVGTISVEVEDPTLCPRYIGMRVEGVTTAPSPLWLKEKIESVGQRSINNIVDITNYILLDIGQPMHAFDAAKVKGGIIVRKAKGGETMTTLDGKDLVLDGDELVIADHEGVLALAGIKGGKKAEVDATTRAIIFESANFEPTLIRKTSQKVGIKTDASKRYENGLTSELAGEGMAMAAHLASQFGGTGVRVGQAIDNYPKHEEKRSVSVSVEHINRLLGTTLSSLEITDIFERQGFGYKAEGDQFVVVPPHERLDIEIPEDVIEEVGRIYGFEHIASTLPNLEKQGLPTKHLHYADEVRKFLVERGFSEVFTYSFVGHGEGEVELANPVGKDRPFMRHNLTNGVVRALTTNTYYAPFLELEEVKIFEIGNVFQHGREESMLALGAMAKTKGGWKKLKLELESIKTELLGKYQSRTDSAATEGPLHCVYEISFDELIEKLPTPTTFTSVTPSLSSLQYKTLSPYPFIVRDVALWVPLETKAEDIEVIIRANAGELAQKIYLFDTFEKEGRKSYAFRMVLQSFERTLEDAEANAVYDRVVAALEKTNPTWEVRK